LCLHGIKAASGPLALGSVAGLREIVADEELAMLRGYQ
jgi:hypothetical protein